MEDLGSRRASSEIRTFNPMTQPMMQPLMQPMMQQPGGPPPMGMQTPKDRTPFTYTPGGLDLSEIKSERMARRLMRNAMSPGVQELPVAPMIPNAPNANAVHRNSMPVQVFPAFQLPTNPRMLLRTRSNPYNRAGSVDRAYDRLDQYGTFDEEEKVTDLPPLPPRQDNNDYYNPSIISQLNDDPNAQQIDYGYNNAALQNIPPQYAQNYGMMLQQPNVGPYNTGMAPQYMEVPNNQNLQYVLNNRGQPVPQNVPLQYIPGYGPIVQPQGVSYNPQLTDIQGNPNVGYVFNNGLQQNVALQNAQLYEQFVHQQNNVAQTKTTTQSSAVTKNENIVNTVEQNNPIQSAQSIAVLTQNITSDQNNVSVGESIVSENDTVANINIKESVTEIKPTVSVSIKSELKTEAPIEVKHPESDQTVNISISSKYQETSVKETAEGTILSNAEQSDHTTEAVSSVETTSIKEPQKESAIESKSNGFNRDENENIVDASLTFSLNNNDKEVNEVNDSDGSVEEEQLEEVVVEEEETVVEVSIAKPVPQHVTSANLPTVESGDNKITVQETIDEPKADAGSEEEEEKVEEKVEQEEEEEEEEIHEVSDEDGEQLTICRGAGNKKDDTVPNIEKTEDNKQIVDSSKTEAVQVQKVEATIEKSEESNAHKITDELIKEPISSEQSVEVTSEEIISEESNQANVIVLDTVKGVTRIEPGGLQEINIKLQDTKADIFQNAEQTIPLKASPEFSREQAIAEDSQSLPGITTSIETNTSQIVNSSSITKQVTLDGTLGESYSNIESKFQPFSNKYTTPTVADNSILANDITSSNISEVSNIFKSKINEKSIFQNTNTISAYPNDAVYPPLSFESTQSSQPTVDSNQYPNIEPYTFVDPKDAYVPSFQKIVHPRVPNLSDRFSVDRIIPKKPLYSDVNIKPFASFKLPQNQSKVIQNNVYNTYSNETTRQDTWKTDRIEHLDEMPSLNIDTNQYSFLNTERPVDPLPQLRSEHSPNFAPPNYITKHVQPPWEVKPSKQPEYKPPVYSPVNTPFMKSVQPPTWESTTKSPTFSPRPFNMPTYKENVSDNTYAGTPKNFSSQTYPAPLSVNSKSDIWSSQTQYHNTYYSDEIEEKEEVEPSWRRELREFAEKKLQPNVEKESFEPIVRPPWMDEVKFRPTKNVHIDPNVAVIPSWAQQSRPRSWRESSVDNDQTKRQANISWQKTNTFNRRPKSAFVKSQLSAPQMDRTRCVSMDRERFAANYQSPVSQSTNSNGYSLPWDSSPERSPMLSPLPSNYDRTSTPHSRTSPYQPNAQSPTYGYYQTPVEQSREYGAYSYQPRNMARGGACPVQSRSFKYLQLLTGTEDDEPFVQQEAMHSQPRPNRL